MLSILQSSAGATFGTRCMRHLYQRINNSRVQHITGMMRRRISSVGEARSLLGIPTHDAVLEMVALRKAYFTAAKQCHPDTSNSMDDDKHCHERFLKVTEAYELLLAQLAKSNSRNSNTTVVVIPKSEEESFRRECQEWLGLSAEIVEECKTNAGFRQWLGGNTDGAHLWRNFLMQHGGLAPRLSQSIMIPMHPIAVGDVSTASHQQRRRRPSRRY